MFLCLVHTRHFMAYLNKHTINADAHDAILFGFHPTSVPDGDQRAENAVSGYAPPILISPLNCVRES